MLEEDERWQKFTIHITCEKGHEQRIGYYGVSREYAESVAGFLDGSSPAFKFPPDSSSVIGKCHRCGTQIKATVLDGYETQETRGGHQSPVSGDAAVEPGDGTLPHKPA